MGGGDDGPVSKDVGEGDKKEEDALGKEAVVRAGVEVEVAIKRLERG